ncbi:MAG: hypothetical protein IJY47_04505 [Clostridia bacterium]|nr:hypothetical protein [Clostridia bacterium]
MERLRGDRMPWNEGVAVGKLCFSAEEGSEGKEAVIWVTAEPPSRLPSTSVVGVLVLRKEGAPSRIVFPLPCPVLFVPELDESLEGKIAILDTHRQSVWVSPDLDTVRRYAEQREGASKSQKAVRFFAWSEDLPRGDRNAQGWILGERFSEGEEEVLFERYRAAAERNPGLPLTVCIPLGEEEGTRLRLRSLYRGAVYGRFSLLFSRIATCEEWERCRVLCHEVFCDLESEGREFNGYLPRGILLDRGLPLLDSWSGREPDFLCVDGEGLFASLSAESLPIPQRIRAMGNGLREFASGRGLQFLLRDPEKWDVTRELLSDPRLLPEAIVLPEACLP